MKQKLTDSNVTVSNGGRAHQYAVSHPIHPRLANVVGAADNGIDQFDIIHKYHLKGFEYGNYVNNNDRYDHLIAAQRSLKHLSHLLCTQNIGINGNIGIAFGARGIGGTAIAHYEPLHNMINLTKKRGASALAHEYGHALDYNLGTFLDQHSKYAALSGGSSVAQRLPDNTGGQLRAMVNDVIDTAVTTQSHQALRKATNSDYWFRRTEIFARLFEQYICYRMQKISTDSYLTKSWNQYTHSIAYLGEKDFMLVLPKMRLLNMEIGKFLNGKGSLISTPYPTTKRFSPYKKNNRKETRRQQKSGNKQIFP